MLRLLALSSVLAPLALAASLDPALTPAPDPADELGALTPTVVVVTDVALDFTGEGERVDLVLAGGRIRTGDHLYADANGIVVAPRDLGVEF